jgi:hypothetical protein
VLRPASWWIPVPRSREVWLSQRGLRRCLEIAADAELLGLPDRFFLTPRGAGPMPSLRARSRKPFWVDVRNPLVVDHLDSLLADATYAYITEALPEQPSWPQGQRSQARGRAPSGVRPLEAPKLSNHLRTCVKEFASS